MFERLAHPALIALIATVSLVRAAAARDAGWPPLHDLGLISWLVIALGYSAVMGLAGRQVEVEFDREWQHEKAEAAQANR
jgi:hypothetical protein